MIEKMMKKIANSQAFAPDDRLSRMVNECDANNELSEDSLDLVFAARKDEADFDAFLKVLEERNKKL